MASIATHHASFLWMIGTYYFLKQNWWSQKSSQLLVAQLNFRKIKHLISAHTLLCKLVLTLSRNTILSVIWYFNHPVNILENQQQNCQKAHLPAIRLYLHACNLKFILTFNEHSWEINLMPEQCFWCLSNLPGKLPKLSISYRGLLFWLNSHCMSS